MAKIFEGRLLGKDLRFAVVMSRSNGFISEKLLDGAKDALLRHEVSEDNIDIVLVPGALEISLAAKNLAKTEKYDAIICLGTVIRGNTPHSEYSASEVTRGVAQVALETGVPVAFGVLTTDNIIQAIERAEAKSGNKGFTAQTAIEMANLIDNLCKVAQ